MQKITLFVNKKCKHCELARNFLLDRNISFKEKDITEPSVAKELLDRNILSVPTFFIDDNVVIGINIAKLNELLNL